VLIAQAYEPRPPVIAHRNPYPFELLQFGEIGLKLLRHLLERKAIRMPNLHSCKSVTSRRVESRAAVPVESVKDDFNR
jgi:hypothetical protein